MSDEFEALQAYAKHENIPWHGTPEVTRHFYEVDEKLTLSAIVWQDDEPELALVHGAGQNAHTWDSMAMAINRPLIAIDLPGHGHSSWREDHDYRPARNASAVLSVACSASRRYDAFVGMSLGGHSCIPLAASAPETVNRLVLIDILPNSAKRIQSMTRAQRGYSVLREGPFVFSCFDELLAKVASVDPSRSVDSLRGSVRNNARRLADGRWTWRYDPERIPWCEADEQRLWDQLTHVKIPVLLVRGSQSAYVTNQDVDEFLRLVPSARAETIQGAGHAIQSDKPVILAALINDFVASAKG